MEHRKIGSLSVSVIGLGCNNFGMTIDEKQTADVISAALDTGINFFDTADMYGGTNSERFLGKALGKRRDEAIVATKCGLNASPEFSGGAKPDYVRRACDASLASRSTASISISCTSPIRPRRSLTRWRDDRSREGRQGPRDRLLELLGGPAQRDERLFRERAE
jgi:aryl-alcohol dehydrogenase-like predicted oxidoreductase